MVMKKRIMTSLERHEMVRTLVSDEVYVATSVTLRGPRRCRKKLVVWDFLG